MHLNPQPSGGVLLDPDHQSVRLRRATALQLNLLALKVLVEHVCSVVVDNDASLGDKDVGEVTLRGRQDLDPRLLGDVPPGRVVDEKVDRRRAVDAARVAACDRCGPGRVAAEFPREESRILRLDIPADC